MGYPALRGVTCPKSLVDSIGLRLGKGNQRVRELDVERGGGAGGERPLSEDDSVSPDRRAFRSSPGRWATSLLAGPVDPKRLKLPNAIPLALPG